MGVESVRAKTHGVPKQDSACGGHKGMSGGRFRVPHGVSLHGATSALQSEATRNKVVYLRFPYDADNAFLAGRLFMLK